MPCATKVMTEVATDNANIGRRNKSTGSNGRLKVACRRTRTYPTQTEPTSSTATNGLACPWPMPLIPAIRKAKAKALNAALAKSKRCSDGGVRGSSRSDARSGGRGDRYRDGGHRDAAPQLPPRVGEAHQRGVDAHHPGGAQPLQGTPDREHRQRM